IQQIEINQALGVQKNNNLNFVAEKSTVIRALLNEKVKIDKSSTSAIIKRDGQMVATLEPRKYSDDTDSVDFLCPSLASCGNWAAGNYLFEVSVNDIKKTTEGSTYQFQERSGVRVLAMAVKANYNGTVTQVSDDKWKTMWQYTQKVYPIADNKFDWKVREEFDASDPKYNLETDEGQRNLWEALTNLMPNECASDPKKDGCYELVVGFISDRPNTYPEGKLQGYTYGRPTNLVVAKDEDAEATVAHEIAHVYGVGDTYAGGSIRCDINPAPDHFKGSDWDNRENSDYNCSSGREALGDVSATKIPASHHPYEIGGRGLLGDMACYMGSGGKQSQFWTTQDAYDHLFSQLAPAGNRKALRATPERLLYYFGYMKENGEVELEPWESYQDVVPVNDSTGDIMLQALDSNGKVVASTKLDIEFYVLSTPPEPIKKMEWAPFEGAMRFPEGTAAFQIIKSGNILKEVKVSANKPSIDNVSPSESMTIEGAYTITWNASDKDGDTLTYTVEYNPDITKPDSEWMVLAGDLEESELSEDFSELPGGMHARIRVTATDGILAEEMESAEFVIPNKVPEVFIDDVEDLASESIEEGMEIVLEGDAFDLEDDWLDEDRLVWSSNISGQIGTGTILVVDDLPVGEHTISLTGTDSSNQSAVDTIRIKILPESDTGSCSATLTSDLKLAVPHIVAKELGNLSFSAVFELTQGQDILFKFMDLSLDPKICETPSTLSSDLTLHIPELRYGDISMWVDLQHTENLVFKVINYGLK
ncbi:MAG: hypothetical protein HQK61_05150, partial [Desulfamplus sp.]|nr:hypothetical protein [Desulfamplus sp.]